MTEETTWNISVKTVMNSSISSSSEFNAESNFNITVRPDDSIMSLYQQIESKTGLKADQQRLIYRGRLIPSQSQLTQNASTMMDISGLGDGHTIHLVPRSSSDASPPSSNTNSGAQQGSAIESNPSSEFPSGFFTTTGPGLLAALLGIHQPDEIQVETVSSSDASGVRGRLRGASTSSTRRRNQNAHVRTAEDPLYPEPCPMENIRQSLMTMHTMMNAQQDQRCRNITHPLQVTRKWYTGQWVDIKDTVNQWLEATVIDIVSPSEILRSDLERRTSLSQATSDKSTVNASDDEVISSNDYDGRLKLLLEPSPDPNDRVLADLNGKEHLVGFREREGNDTVQLLRVHYNGWPNRWDEWLRSDSDRIRPFRTRSRHVQKSNQYCPSLEHSICHETNTYIRSNNNDVENVALLPEILRTITGVQSLYSEALHERVDQHSSSQESAPEKLNRMQLYDLSVVYHRSLKADYYQDFELMEEQVQRIRDIILNSGRTFEDLCSIQLESLDDTTQVALYKLLIPSNVKLQCKAERFPWIGIERVTDPDEFEQYELEAHELQAAQYKASLDKKKMLDLAPLLDRLGRILIDAAPHVANIASSLPDPKLDINSDEETDSKPTAIENTEMDQLHHNEDATQRPLRPSWATNTRTAEHTTDIQNDVSILPDHVDFINSFINHRNDSNGSRNRSSGNSGSSLLSSYLSNVISGNGRDANMVRLGGGPGSVDVHIHAIVTGPGGAPINPIRDFFPSRNTTPSSSFPNENTQQHVVVPSEETNNLFADLYGATHDPGNEVEIDDEEDEEDQDYHPDSEDEEDESYYSDSDEHHSSSSSCAMPDLESRRSSSSSSSMDHEDEDDPEALDHNNSVPNAIDDRHHEDSNQIDISPDSLPGLEIRMLPSYDSENEIRDDDEQFDNQNSKISGSSDLPALESKDSESLDLICSKESDAINDHTNISMENEEENKTVCASDIFTTRPASNESTLTVLQRDQLRDNRHYDNLTATQAPSSSSESTQDDLNQRNSTSVRRWLQRMLGRE